MSERVDYCSICAARLTQQSFIDLVPDIPDCTLCHGLFTKEPEILFAFTTAAYEDLTDVNVSIQMKSNQTQPGDIRIFSIKDALKLRLKRQLPAFRTNASALLPAVTLEVVISATWTVTTQVKRGSIYISGRYIKRSRSISQSKWFTNSEVKPVTSIEELIIKHLHIKEGAVFRFSGSGREDMDVRMLGAGREFCMEVENLTSYRGVLEYSEDGQLVGPVRCTLANVITEEYELLDFRLVEKTYVKWLASTAETHSKTYGCVVHSTIELPNQTQLDRLSVGQEISQRTPIRTLQRRTDAVRKKFLYQILMKRLNDHFMYVEMKTSAGMYIKEFVHGDLGRTKLELGELIGVGEGKMDILQLDVLEVGEQEGDTFLGLVSEISRT
jgi:tRNA pseudouridine(54/55) synthase